MYKEDDRVRAGERKSLDLSGDGIMKNLVTGAQADSERCKFIFECITDGEEAYQNFFTTRFKEKTKHLFDPIPKLRKRGNTSKVPSVNIQNETYEALRCIDVSRARRYDVAELLKYELTPTSLYLTKDGYLRKSQKSDLQREIEKNLVGPMQPTDMYASDIGETAVIVDFMAYSRKVPVKQLKFKTFGDMASNVWDRFIRISGPAKRLDIVFDVSQTGGIKYFERLRRRKSEPVEVTIHRDDTPLMVDMKAFLASTGNNTVRWETFFTKWVVKTLSDDDDDSQRVVFLGGCHADDVLKCVQIDSWTVGDVLYLHCQHDEADDRILLHVNQAVATGAFKRIIVASPDTYIFFCLLYHFNCTWKQQGLLELWILCGHGNTSRAVPIHELNDKLECDTVTVLPAIHALSGCDTTSKVSTKHAALKVGSCPGAKLLSQFEKTDLTDEVQVDAEHFLVQAAAGNDKLNTFDELRFHEYHHKTYSNSFERLSPTFGSIRLHIRSAYFQCHRWLFAPDCAEIRLDPLKYGYELRKDGILVPVMVPEMTLPDDFPLPCRCGKCARPGICPCRKADTSCCQFCKCEASEMCQNP